MGNNDKIIKKKFIITLGREFGSGGRKIGKQLADLLGIKFYDKELIAIAAKESGLSENLFEGIDEKPTNSLLYSLVMGVQTGRGNFYRYGDLLNSDAIFRIQTQVIEELVEKDSCVIVGRCSDYILRERDNVLNLFIHANDDFKLERVKQLYKFNHKDAIDIIRKTDKKRSNYYNFYTNQEWGEVSNYQLSIDSSFLGLEDTAEFISQFVKRKFGE